MIEKIQRMEVHTVALQVQPCDVENFLDAMITTFRFRPFSDRMFVSQGWIFLLVVASINPPGRKRPEGVSICHSN